MVALETMSLVVVAFFALLLNLIFSDSDLTKFFSKESKVKFLNKTTAQIFSFKEEIFKAYRNLWNCLSLYKYSEVNRWILNIKLLNFCHQFCRLLKQKKQTRKKFIFLAAIIKSGYMFFVLETYLLHLSDSCRFLNCSVSISIFCHVVWHSWPNHMA